HRHEDLGRAARHLNRRPGEGRDPPVRCSCLSVGPGLRPQLSGILGVSQSPQQTAGRFAARNRVAKHHSWEPSAMPFMPSAFARLLEPLDRRVMARLVAEHQGDRGVGKGEHAWTCERHLKTLLLAQWAGLKSLREIVAGLEGRGACFYHLNLRAPCRSTLSDANARRPAGVFGAIAAAL